MDTKFLDKDKLRITQLGDADAVTCFRITLEGALLGPVVKIISDEVQARNGLEEKEREQLDVFAKRLGSVISSMVWGTLLQGHVIMDDDRDKLGLLLRWTERPLPNLNIRGDEDLTLQARSIAGKLVAELLSFLCEQRLGISFDKLLRRAQQETARKVLQTKIGLCSPSDMRAAVMRFMTHHAQLLGAPSPQLAVPDLYALLDLEVMKLMPGKSTAVGGLEALQGQDALAAYKAGSLKLASAAEDVAEKLYKAPEVPVLPIQAKEKKGPETREKPKVQCFDCGEPGLMRGHQGCDKRLKRRPKEQGALQLKPEQPCNICGENGHFQRKCPHQTCLGCQEKGHCKRDCNKPQSSGCVEVPANPILIVEATVDGKQVQVGLDTCAGIGLATPQVVDMGTLEPSRVRLHGVAEQIVVPHGETNVKIRVGDGPGFTERVAVVDKLPGGVPLMVGFEALQRVGLQLHGNTVRVGGETCTLREGLQPGTSAALQVAKTVEQKSVGHVGESGNVKVEGPDAVTKREKEQVDARRAAKEARRMLRAADGRFSELESKGLIEEVVMEEDGTCGGYREAFPESSAPKRVGQIEAQESRVAKARPMTAKEVAKAVKRAKREKSWAKRQLRQSEWEAVRDELELLAEKNEAGRVAMTVEAQTWAKVGAEQVQEGLGVAAAPVGLTVRAVDAIERGSWDRTASNTFLGTEQNVTEVVDADEYCVPESWTEEQREKWMQDYKVKVKELAAHSALRSEESRRKYCEIMMKHHKAYCFSLEDFVPGRLDVEPLVLHVEDGPPIVDARRQLSLQDEEWFREKVVSMEKVGLIQSPTEEMIRLGLYVANAVIVKQLSKVSGEVERRLTIDYWGPNSRIKAPPQRIPVVGELADRLHDAVLFDKDDGISGYYQWPLHEDSRRFTGFYTPLGIKVFKCMPLGINVAPSVWNGAMAERFGDIPGNRFFALMDDFIRFTPKQGRELRKEVEDDHLLQLDLFLGKVEAARLKLKLPKAVHAVEEVEALGMMYGRGTVSKTEWTSQVIRDYPVPTSAKKLDRFLHLGQYYSQFVEGYARAVAPLRKLAQKQHWSRRDMAEGSEERQLFERVRANLLENLKLAVPDWDKEFVTKSDFSEQAIGGALLQKDQDGHLRPIAFVSRKCTAAESKLSAPDGEMVALVWTIKRFEKYLLGRKFTAYVDQGSLSWLKDRSLSSINNKRLQGAFAYLRQFQFDLMYRKSKDMQDVDALSRAVAAVSVAGKGSVVVETEWNAVAVAATATKGVAQVDLEGYWGFDTMLKDLGELQHVDDEVVAVRQLMGGKKGLTDIEVVPSARANIARYLSIDPKCENFVEGFDGRLYHLERQNGEWVRQVYVPLCLRGRLVVAKHGSAASGHRAAAETLAKMRKHYYWMSMKRDIEAMIASCGCQQKKGERKQRVGELKSLKLMRPGEKVIFDIFGPLPVSLKGNTYLLVVVDVGTREVMLEALPSREAVGVAKVIFERVYLRGMAPRLFQSDQAKEFVSAVMKELTALLGAEFRHSSPYHPQTNTHVERYNKTIATNLSLLLRRQDQRDWDEYLKHVEYAQLVGAQQVLGRMSPLFLKGGWEALDPIDRAFGTEAVKTDSKLLQKWMEDLQKARQIAMQSQELSVAREAKRMELKVKELNVDVGDKVWVMFPNVGAGKSRKLAFKMHGTYILKRWLHDGKRVALLGHEREDKDEIVVHVDRMVKKTELSKTLREAWQPLRVEPAAEKAPSGKAAAHRGQKRAEQVAEKVVPQKTLRKQKAEERKERAKIAGKIRKLDKETAKELQKELENEDYRIEKILDHEEEKDGSRQYKVRFVGYGPKDDLWYAEEDLLETAPEMVADYEEQLEERERLLLQDRRPDGGRRPRREQRAADKVQ
jgi:transposase InsO family protein